MSKCETWSAKYLLLWNVWLFGRTTFVLFFLCKNHHNPNNLALYTKFGHLSTSQPVLIREEKTWCDDCFGKLFKGKHTHVNLLSQNWFIDDCNKRKNKSGNHGKWVHTRIRFIWYLWGVTESPILCKDWWKFSSNKLNVEKTFHNDIKEWDYISCYDNCSVSKIKSAVFTVE